MYVLGVPRATDFPLSRASDQQHDSSGETQQLNFVLR